MSRHAHSATAAEHASEEAAPATDAGLSGRATSTRAAAAASRPSGSKRRSDAVAAAADAESAVSAVAQPSESAPAAAASKRRKTGGEAAAAAASRSSDASPARSSRAASASASSSAAGAPSASASPSTAFSASSSSSSTVSSASPSSSAASAPASASPSSSSSLSPVVFYSRTADPAHRALSNFAHSWIAIADEDDRKQSQGTPQAKGPHLAAAAMSAASATLQSPSSAASAASSAVPPSSSPLRWYPSVEHYFQSRKFAFSDRPALALLFSSEAEGVSPSLGCDPLSAKSAGGKGGMSRRGATLDCAAWSAHAEAAMDRALRAKFAQPAFAAALRFTGSRPLRHFERQPGLWGCNTDKRTGLSRGHNLLGTMLQRIRDNIHKQESSAGNEAASSAIAHGAVAAAAARP